MCLCVCLSVCVITHPHEITARNDRHTGDLGKRERDELERRRENILARAGKNYSLVLLEEIFSQLIVSEKFWKESTVYIDRIDSMTRPCKHTAQSASSIISFK